jgi:hypothetical protein
MPFTKNFRLLRSSASDHVQVYLLNRTTNQAIWFRDDGKIESLSADEFDTAHQPTTSKISDAYGCIGVLEIPVGMTECLRSHLRSNRT